MDTFETPIIKKEFAEGTPGHVQNAKYFYFNTPPKRQSPLNILCGGYEQCAPDFNINRKNFPFFVVIYTVSGKGTFRINGIHYALGYGSLIAFRPHIPYELMADPLAPMEQFFLLFIGNQANQLLKKSTMAHKSSVKVSSPQAILSNFQQILKIGLNQTEYAHEICCNYLKAILLEQADEKYNTYLGNTSFENFLRCKNYLENNFTRIHSSAQLADECCINIRYLARLFRKFNNTRPCEYLMNLKMNKAVNLLLTANFNINQVAKMTGIDDSCHFSRIFKKKFNLSPKEYRNRFHNV